MEYEEFDWFIKQIGKSYERKNIRKKLDMLEVLSVSQGLNSKKGLSQYKRYVGRLKNRHNRLFDTEETFWDKIKKTKNKTLFDRLKENAGNK